MTLFHFLSNALFCLRIRRQPEKRSRRYVVWESGVVQRLSMDDSKDSLEWCIYSPAYVFACMDLVWS